MNGEERYEERLYRGLIEPPGLDCYNVKEGESDLYVCTRGVLSEAAARSLSAHREALELYLRTHASFGTSYVPVPAVTGAPGIVHAMARAARQFGVGPMAAVAGAVADCVGTDLLEQSPDVIVENGGDIFMAGGRRRRARVFAGRGRAAVDVVVEDTPQGVGLCTSSAGVGPSVSLGVADAVTVLAGTAADADAAATALANSVRSADDIGAALDSASENPLIRGAVIVMGEVLGAWGEIEIA